MKYVLAILGIIVALFLILGLLGPKDMNVTEQVKIDAPPSIIYNLVNDLPTTAKWNTWSLADSSMVTTYSDQTSGIGATSSWESTSQGNGTQEIIESVPNKRVKSQLSFEGWDGDNFAQFDINPEGSQTNVSWSFEGSPLPFFFRPIALITGMKSSMTKNYKGGLSNLKNIAEQRAAGLYDGLKINEKDLEDQHYAMLRQMVPLDKVQQYYSTQLTKLFTSAQKAGIEMDGNPRAFFFKYDENGTQTDMAAAIPVADESSLKGTTPYHIKVQKAIVTDFVGTFEESAMAHYAIDAYMKDRGYLQNPPVIEEYLTNESADAEENEAGLTRITYFYTQSSDQ